MLCLVIVLWSLLVATLNNIFTLKEINSWDANRGENRFFFLLNQEADSCHRTCAIFAQSYEKYSSSVQTMQEAAM